MRLRITSEIFVTAHNQVTASPCQCSAYQASSTYKIVEYTISLINDQSNFVHHIVCAIQPQRIL